MKKFIYLSTLMALLGCVTAVREPAALKKAFHFDLFGANPPTAANFEYELLKFQSLPGQVEFEKFPISEPQAEKRISDWQTQLAENLKNNPKGYFLEVKKVIVDVSGDDMRLLVDVLAAVDQTEQNPSLRLRKKVETISAFNEHFKDSMDVRIDVLLAPFSLLGRISNQTIPVENAAPLKRAPSSFWQPRPSADMWNGPGRLDFTKINQEICTYHSPKTGFGVHAGFKIKCLGEKLKVKFGNEVYSGPFNSRIYNRLGYNVPAIHFVPELKIAYSRRMLSEINSRKKKYFRFRMAGIPVHDMGRLALYDSFEFIKSAHLKSGEVVSAAEMKSKLVRLCEKAPCDFSDENINADFESQIAYVTFQPSTVTEPIGDEVGPWNYSNLDHTQRPEVKSLLLLGAWTGNFDLRKDNTRLVLDRETGELKHFISDPGSGLGNPKFLGRSGSKISDLNWRTTMETRLMGEEETPVVGLSGYNILEANDAFRKVTFQDAQWMVRMIGGVSEQEISEALAASGLSAAEFLMAREKLVSIRQKMIEHFQLKSEFSGQLRKINQTLSFDPSRDHVDVRFRDGRVVRLQNRGVRLVNGALQFP